MHVTPSWGVCVVVNILEDRPLIGLDDPSLDHSFPDHLLYGILQYAKYGATLEEYPEATVDGKCRCASNFGHPRMVHFISLLCQLYLVPFCTWPLEWNHPFSSSPPPVHKARKVEELCSTWYFFLQFYPH